MSRSVTAGTLGYANNVAWPVATYAQLATEYAAPVMRGPFNLSARKAAGF